jgi:hypothetical protein
MNPSGMIPKSSVFCNTPWYELHIYWDGSFGACCQESEKPYSEDQSETYNVKRMTIREWMSSSPMQSTRRHMFADQKQRLCSNCDNEEVISRTSRRHRSNFKSAIFDKAFSASYQQSPHFKIFDHSRLHAGASDNMPVDLHIDLGNYCNLACKMCHPRASSRIASQYRKWNIIQDDNLRDWTKDQSIWQKVLAEIGSIANLKNVHFMGGETLLTPRLEDFVDHMITIGKTDINISFVSNGTLVPKSLLSKLNKFQRIGIEVSIETLDDRNHYTRQGSVTSEILKNIDIWVDWCDGDQQTVTLRPAISALTIGGYHTLLDYAHKNKLVIKSTLVTNPDYLNVNVLPDSVRKHYQEHYLELERRLGLVGSNIDTDFNQSNHNEIDRVIANQIRQSLSLLRSDRADQADTLLQQMVEWCWKWDQVFGFDARDIYPELRDIWKKYGYAK